MKIPLIVTFSFIKNHNPQQAILPAILCFQLFENNAYLPLLRLLRIPTLKGSGDPQHIQRETRPRLSFDQKFNIIFVPTQKKERPKAEQAKVQLKELKRDCRCQPKGTKGRDGWGQPTRCRRTPSESRLKKRPWEKGLWNCPLVMEKLVFSSCLLS